MDGRAESSVISPREKAIAQVKEDARYGDKLFTVSDHFAVVYNKPHKIYQRFGPWLDKDPASLNGFLEDNLPKALDHFQITQAVPFQVIQISEGGHQSGLHKRKKRIEGVGFSDVHAKAVDKATQRLDIYNTSLHEAIGHGIVNATLLGSDSPRRKIKFLEEGLAEYLTHFLAGKNSHDVYQRDLLSRAFVLFPELKDDTMDTLTDDEIQKRLKNKKGKAIPLGESFRLQSDTRDVLGRSFFSPHTLAEYNLSASFFKFLIDTYGMNKLKTWAGNITTKTFAGSVTSDNFYQSLESQYEITIAELEDGWKDAVLQKGLSDNTLLADKNFETEDADTKKAILDRVTAFYRQYA